MLQDDDNCCNNYSDNKKYDEIKHPVIVRIEF